MTLRDSLTWDANSNRHLVFILLTAAAVGAFGPWGLLVYPALHITADIFYYGLGVAYFDPAITVQRGYQVGAVLSDALHSQGIDYGFNFYDGDFDKDRSQAQEDKFRYAWNQLGLQAGMRLLDCGCGCGDWLSWCRAQGVEVKGINITREQVMVCRSRGLDVIHADWRDVAQDEERMRALEGQFDCLTFWDTVEHYVPMKYRSNYAKSDAVYTQLFEFSRRLQKKESPSGRIFISCLHMRKNLRDISNPLRLVRVLASGWLLDKFHSGNYPSASRDALVKNAEPWYRLQNRKDTTLDYYMTSVLESTHFGRHKFRWTRSRLVYILWCVVADPFWAARFLWFSIESWMFQFDPDDITQSAVVHWWLTLQSRPTEPHSA